MLNLILLLIISLTALAVGFARQEEPTVKVPLSSSVRLKGATYHPHSQGVEMPVSHAKALGFTESDYLGEEPEEDEDTSESESKGDSDDDDSSGESESEESSEGNKAEEPAEEDSKEETEQEADKQAIEEAEAEQGDEPLKPLDEVKKELEPIPDDTPELDKLIADERFGTIESLLAHKEELTDIKGIGPATAEEIIEHVTEAQKG